MSKHSLKSQTGIHPLLALLLGSIIGYEAGIYSVEKTPVLCSDHAVVQVRFSPKGHCTEFIAATVAKAQEKLLVPAYYFTSPSIAEALVAAHLRGVVVKVLVDRSQLTGKKSQVQHMIDQGIAVAIDKVPGIAKNKVMIIDDTHVLTGSFNWTQSAETRNAENIVLIKDKEVNRIYTTNWNQRAQRASSVPL